MIKFKKAVISSILAAIVIFGAVMPMASAATAPNSGIRTPGFEGGFGVYSNGGSGTVNVYNIDYDITKVELYDNSGAIIRSAVNPNAGVTGSQVTSGQVLTQVEFKNLNPGNYSVAVFAGLIKS